MGWWVRGLLGLVVPRLTADERSAEVRAMLKRGPPLAVVIDRNMTSGAWMVRRGPATAAERALAGAGDGFAETALLEDRR